MFAYQSLGIGRLLLWGMFCSANIAQSAVPKISEGHVEVPGGKIWYAEHRPEVPSNKDPLIVISGGPGMSYDYLENLSQLARERTVVFYDQLGSYKSPVKGSRKDLWRIARFVEELHLLIERLKLKKVVLYGQSWGGSLAVQYALTHPDRVSRLILASPLLSAAEWMKHAQKLAAQLPKKDREALQKPASRREYEHAIRVFTDRHIFRPKTYPKALSFSFDHANEEVYTTMWGVNELEITGNLKDLDLTLELRKITQPVLITVGRYDEAGADHLAEMARRFKQGQFVCFEKSSHMAHLEETENYFRALEKFLK